MALGQTRPASRRQAELDAWLARAAAGDVVDLASLRGGTRPPTGLLQQLAEAVLDNSVTIAPEGGLGALRHAWARFDAQRGMAPVDPEQGMAVVADPLAASISVILGLVSPGRHVAVVEPAPPQVVEVVRRAGAMARTVSMRPTDWEFDPEEFAQRVGPRTDLIVVADPNPLSGQFLPEEARAAILAAVRQFGCGVLLDQSARHSVIGEDDPGAAAFVAALGPHCLRVDMPAAAALAAPASVAAVFGASEWIVHVRSAASSLGLGAGVSAQSVNARRFEDGSAVDDIATLNGIVASGRALVLDGLDDIGVAGLGGPGGWFVPVRARALYAGPQDIGEVLVEKAGLGVLPLAPFYAEGSSDPYILMSYLRDAALLEHAIERLAAFYDGEVVRYEPLALPAPDDEGDLLHDDDDEDEDYEDEEYEEDVFDGGDASPGDDPPWNPVVHEQARTDTADQQFAHPGQEAVQEDASVPDEESGVAEDDDGEYLFRSGDGDGFPESPAEPDFEPAPAQPEPEATPEARVDEGGAAESAQVIEMAEADAKYRAAMAGMPESHLGIGEEYHHTDDAEADSGNDNSYHDESTGPEDVGTGDGEERDDPVILPFGRWREARRARRARREEPVVGKDAGAKDAPDGVQGDNVAPEADPDDAPDAAPDAATGAAPERKPAPEEDQEIPVFSLSVPDMASPEISAPPRRVREDNPPVTSDDSGEDEPEEADDVLMLSEDDALPPSEAQEPRAPEEPVEDSAPGEGPDGKAADKRPRDDRPFFFDDPVV